jgi:SRSO17 transposase
VWVADREHTLVAAPNEATGEVKYFVTNATTTPLPRVLAVAFRRWTVEHAFRLGKQEAGLMDYEGRDYTGLRRHPVLALVVLGFVATHTERLRGENPQVTAEQVCRALNQRCGVVFRRRRGVPEVRHTGGVVRYHQRRNAQAAKSHKKQRHRCVI